MAMEPPSEVEQKSKYAEETAPYSPVTSHEVGTVTTTWQDTLAELKYSFTTKDGWIGNYVSFLKTKVLRISTLTTPRTTST